MCEERKVDFDNRIELWLCDDCLFGEAYDDYTSIDEGSDRKTDRRIREIEEGLESLWGRGQLANDYAGDETQRECEDCGHIGRQEDFQHVAETDDEDEHWACPKCDSVETRERDSGHDEFSWSECDCCGSKLGGSRTRYALFPFVEE